MSRNPPAAVPESEPEFVAGLRRIFEQQIAFNAVLGLEITGLRPEGVAGCITMQPQLVGHFLHKRLP